MKGFIIGAIAGGVAMWLYGDQIREYVDDMTFGVRERTAAKLEDAADRLQSVAQSVRSRAVVARGFTYVEDVLYVGLGVLLAGAALVLLADGAVMFWRALVGGELPARVIELLDRILLILMIAEILYTVQVSLREHSLVPEPFLVVALIAGVRRVLIITAEFADLLEKGPEAFRNAMIELGLLTVMIVALVASLMLLRRRTAQPEAKRA
jgi:uncharacterized membrane protein (DUF373 family)